MYTHGLLGQSGIAGNSSEDTAAETEQLKFASVKYRDEILAGHDTRSGLGKQALDTFLALCTDMECGPWRSDNAVHTIAPNSMLQAVRKQFADYDDSTQDRIQQSTIDQAIRHLVENSTLRITVVAKHKTDKTHCLQWIDIGIWINIIEAGAQKLKILWTRSRQSISSDWYDSSTLAGAGIMAAMSLPQQCWVLLWETTCDISERQNELLCCGAS